MNNSEVLTRAIQKALNNGWTFFHNLGLIQQWKVIEGFKTMHGVVIFVDVVVEMSELGMFDSEHTEHFQYPMNDILFNHEFAKYLWGKNWTRELAGLALVEDRIAYLNSSI